MVSAPQTVIERIWSRILFFAMLSLEQHPNTSPWQFRNRKINSERLQLLLVSSLFKVGPVCVICRLCVLMHPYRSVWRCLIYTATQCFAFQLDTVFTFASRSTDSRRIRLGARRPGYFNTSYLHPPLDFPAHFQPDAPNRQPSRPYVMERVHCPRGDGRQYTSRDHWFLL